MMKRIILTASLLLILMLNGFSQSGGQFIVLVNDGNNAITHIDWNERLNLYDAFMQRSDQSKSSIKVLVISGETSKIYRDSDEERWRTVQLSAGTIIIIGGIDSVRRSQLEEISEIREAVKKLPPTPPPIRF